MPVLLAVSLLVGSASAQAHAEQGSAAGFAAGFSHPWSGWDHILAMVAVGLWGAQLGQPAIWLLPVAFPMIMSVGGFLGLIGYPLPGVELGIGLSALCLGCMVAFVLRPPLWAAMALVGIFGLFHGHAHGTELPAGHDGVTYSLGFVIATGCLHGLGIALGLAHRWKAGELALRLGGFVIALGGAFFTWHALA